MQWAGWQALSHRGMTWVPRPRFWRAGLLTLAFSCLSRTCNAVQPAATFSSRSSVSGYFRTSSTSAAAC